MIKVISSIVLSVITIIAIGKWVVDVNTNTGEIEIDKVRFGIIAGAAFVLFLGSTTITKIPVNSVGVKYSDIKGSINENPYNSGIHLKTPFVDKITMVSTELRSADIDDMQITSADSQEIWLDIELQYHVKPENAVETFKQFRSTPESQWIDTFVYQRIQRGVQDSASNYTVIELMGEKRGEFQKEVDETIAIAMEENYLTVHTSSVDDIQISDSIRQSIEANAKAKQDVETARQVKAKNEVENETKLEKAEAEAKVKEVEALAEANANKLISESIDSNTLADKEAEARLLHGWYTFNGMTPQVMVDKDKE